MIDTSFKLPGEKIEKYLNHHLTKKSWIDSLQQKIRLRKNAIEELLAQFFIKRYKRSYRR